MSTDNRNQTKNDERTQADGVNEIISLYQDGTIIDSEFVVLLLRKIPEVGIQTVVRDLPEGHPTDVFVEWIGSLADGKAIWHPKIGVEPVSDETVALIRNYLSSRG